MNSNLFLSPLQQCVFKMANVEKNTDKNVLQHLHALNEIFRVIKNLNIIPDHIFDVVKDYIFKEEIIVYSGSKKRPNCHDGNEKRCFRFLKPNYTIYGNYLQLNIHFEPLMYSIINHGQHELPFETINIRYRVQHFKQVSSNMLLCQIKRRNMEYLSNYNTFVTNEEGRNWKAKCEWIDLKRVNALQSITLFIPFPN